MPNITIAEPELRQALEGIECPPHFRHLKAAIWHEWRSGYLDFVVEQVMQNNKIDTLVSAIHHLIVSQMEAEKKKIKVTLSDLEKNSHNGELYKKIDKITGKPKNPAKKADPSREFGIRGHVTIPNLFSGSFIKLEKKFFKQNTVRQEIFDFGGEINFPEHVSPAEKKDVLEKVTLNHIKKIQILWRKIVHKLGADMFPSETVEYKNLVELMLMVFGDDLRLVLKLGEKSKEHSYLSFLTVLTWVTALLRYRNEGTSVLFKEVRLFPHYYDVSLGRIDALEVVGINGHAPNEKETKILQRLSEVRYDSVGHLIYTLVQRFGKKISLKIHDWKFAVGDGDNGSGKTLNIIHFNDIQMKPLKKHLNQMERYLSTSVISYGMVANLAKDSINPWYIDDFEISGEIHYFFPDKIHFSHSVTMTNEEKKESFGRIAANYTDGELRRKILNVSESWLTTALDLSIGKQKKQTSKGSQLRIPNILETTEKNRDIHQTGRISRFIKNSVVRKWMDQYEIVEDDGTPIPKMHLDRLFDAIEKGIIRVGTNFDFATGGHVSCFLPDHGHTGKGTPSLSITYKNGGGFKCFGSCGVSGKIATGSLPHNFAGQIQPASKKLSVRSFKDIEAFQLSPRHEEVMGIAQRIFQNQFLSSPGANYLAEERKLNPELSMTIGAGYANERAVHYMLDMGVTYDEMIEFGFIRFSHKIKEHSGNNLLVNLLKQRGFSIDEMKRPWPKTVDGVPRLEPALPYVVLNNVVTYPLDVNHRMTSFYGRSVDKNCPKDHAHTKTAPKGVPQGGFNLSKAMDDAIAKVKKEGRGEAPQILVTEAPIDADTMYQFGDLKEAGAFVGVNNNLLFQILALFPGSIVTALNWDQSKIFEGKETGLAGQRNTIKFVEFLKSVHFDYPVYDFTESFAKKVPEFNDLNGHWKKVWADYWQKKLPGADSSYLNPFDVHYTKKRIL